MTFFERVKSLFTDHHDGLQRFVFTKLKSWEDAEEIVQDAFQNYLRIEDHDKVENPKAFLYKTAHNLALNHLRKSGYRSAHLASLDADQCTVSLEQEVFSQQDLERVAKHLHTLPELTRRIFLCQRIQGMTYPDIARQFELTENQVQKHMVKALNYLRKHIDRTDPTSFT